MSWAEPRRVLLVAVLVLVTGCGPEVGAVSGPAGTTPAEQTTSTRSTSAARTTAPATTATPSTGRNGSVVARLIGQSGQITVVPSDQGFTVLRELLGQGMADQSLATAYDGAGRPLATLHAPAFTGDCGVTDVVADGHRLLLTRAVTRQPAAGINPELYSETLTAWDARSGARVWDVPVTAPREDHLGCDQYDGPRLDGLQVTSDGRYGVLLPAYSGPSPLLVDLPTGTATPIPDLAGVVGNWVVRQVDDGDDVDATDIVMDPATGTELSRFTDDQDQTGVTFGPDPLGWSTHSFGGQYGTDPTGTIVFGSRAGDRFDEALGYQLPGMGLLWETARDTGDLRPWGASETVLLAGFGDLGFETGMVALSPQTGAELWSLPEVRFCGVTGSQIAVQANDQWAVIDAATGAQVEYGALDASGAEPYSTCSVTLDGLSYDVGDDDTVTVYRALQP